MIPILFESGTTNFNTNGIGRLRDCISCRVVEERNGIYECEFEYPISGVNFERIERGCIVTCPHDDKGDYQPFIIYRRTVPDLRGVVRFYAHHISYRLSDITVMPFKASSCADALQKIPQYSVTANPFTFWTDKSTVVSYSSEIPRLARSMLGGEENSILDAFGGGEYEFSGYTVKLYASRGVDSGVTIRYGKNLSDINQDIDNSGTYNAVVPYWTDSDGHIVTLPEKYITYTGIGDERIDTAPMDLSSDFDEKPTVSQLRNKAMSRLNAGKTWIPDENLKVDFVALWQTEEYKNFAGLQRVGLCDTVDVIYPAVGINKIKQKVVKTVYNVLLERFDSIELGALQTSLGKSIKSEILEIVPTTSIMEEAIKYASDMIRGGLGGYVVMTPGEDGYPQEILIMDTPDVNTAVNVWRFNQGGLGHSHNGYDGPFSDIALTSDGRINATLITTGALNAGIITTGILKDANNNTSFNLDTGAFSMKKGSINLGNGNFVATDAGKITVLGGGLIQDESGLNSWNLDTGNLVVGQGQINADTITSGKLKIGTSGSNRARLELYDRGDFVGELGADGSLYFTNGSGTSLSEAYFDSEGFLLEAGGSIAGRLESDNSTGSSIGSSPRLLFNSPNEIVIKAGTVSGISLFTTPPITRPGTEVLIDGETRIVDGGLTVAGTKSRIVGTSNYSDRLLYCYETPTPLFGDIGEAIIDEDGFGFVDIDDIFSETVAERVEYQVFLQAEGEGSCYISEKTPRYFVIQGTPNLKVAWELKAKQKDYENIRLEQADIPLDEYEQIPDDTLSLESYITEQEALLYG